MMQTVLVAVLLTSVASDLPHLDVLGKMPWVHASPEMLGSSFPEGIAHIQFDHGDPLYVEVERTQSSSDWILVELDDCPLAVPPGSTITFTHKNGESVTGTRILARRECREARFRPGWEKCRLVDITASGFNGMARELGIPRRNTTSIVLAVEVPRRSVKYREATGKWRKGANE